MLNQEGMLVIYKFVLKRAKSGENDVFIFFLMKMTKYAKFIFFLFVLESW